MRNVGDHGDCWRRIAQFPWQQIMILIRKFFAVGYADADKSQGQDRLPANTCLLSRCPVPINLWLIKGLTLSRCKEMTSIFFFIIAISFVATSEWFDRDFLCIQRIEAEGTSLFDRRVGGDGEILFDQLDNFYLYMNNRRLFLVELVQIRMCDTYNGQWAFCCLMTFPNTKNKKKLGNNSIVIN